MCSTVTVVIGAHPQLTWPELALCTVRTEDRDLRRLVLIVGDETSPAARGFVADCVALGAGQRLVTLLSLRLGCREQLVVLRAIDFLSARSSAPSLDRGTTGGVCTTSRIGVMSRRGPGQTVVNATGRVRAPRTRAQPDRPIDYLLRQAALNRSRLPVHDAAPYHKKGSGTVSVIHRGRRPARPNRRMAGGR